jgi:hypothetical protein
LIGKMKPKTPKPNYKCPNPDCKSDYKGFEGQHCPECGSLLKEPSMGTGTKIIIGVAGIIVLLLLIGVVTLASTPQNQSTVVNNTTIAPTTTPAPTPTPAFQPLTFSGTGNTATQSFSWPGGLMRVSFSHTGSSNFIIHLVSASDGSVQEYMVNEIGSVNGSRAFSEPAGTYILDIQADGTWNVKITNS